ncbi:3-oxoacid CoA-transferase subunit A [Noviherbaspirillum sp. Root189]|uniref:3-oxoacid CoA-transferase subunit A n=1 Tax=Noviherbaspirillum sp. Root189 TaxID=1736487 RepID=UPI00070D59EE|nr:3-oxoacid CoA-transferase subunit A [Noviherbaspirillum sp. Root189]KRB67990.1 3-oxoadipate CoA-transferase [Noviherbaspirillum sp. Root189]
MLDKTIATVQEAVRDVFDGAVLMIGGFGISGVPTELVRALLDQGATDLVIVNNNAGNGKYGLSELIEAGRVRKMICSFARSSNPLQPNAIAFADAWRAGKIELECVPQGTMAERMRAAGAGLGPFFTPTSFGTSLAAGKETRVIDGVGYVLEQPLKGDFAFVKAQQGDRWGNLTFRYAERNFGPVMCMAARTAVAQVDEIMELGAIAPEHVMTPGIFVQRVVRVVQEELQ